MDRTDIIKCILIAFITLIILKFVMKMFQKEDKQIKVRNALETPFPEPLNEEF